MACSRCGHKKTQTTTKAQTQSQPVAAQAKAQVAPIAQASANPKAKVRVRYYGGGMTYQTTGCRSCGSVGKYALTTQETIQFASIDEPNGWFSQVFSMGHDYYVTEEQAKYLVSLTFRNAAGQKVNKFKLMEE